MSNNVSLAIPFFQKPPPPPTMYLVSAAEELWRCDLDNPEGATKVADAPRVSSGYSLGFTGISQTSDGNHLVVAGNTFNGRNTPSTRATLYTYYIQGSSWRGFAQFENFRFPTGVLSVAGITRIGSTYYVPTSAEELWSTGSTIPSGATKVGDFPAAIQHARGLINIGNTLYIIDHEFSASVIDRLFQCAPDNPAGATLVGEFPDTIQTVTDISEYGGVLYPLVYQGSGNPSELWRCDPGNPSGATKVGDFPASVEVRGIHVYEA